MPGMPGFWKSQQQENRTVMLTGFGQLQKTHYIFPQGNGPRGAFSTFAQCAQVLKSRDQIIIGGVLREQAVAPLNVYDVTVIGAANRPRQATSGGVPTGGGATWMAPASGAVAATALLEIRAQGWSFENLSFTPHTSSPGVLQTRSASVDTIDASHATYIGCLFNGQGGTGQIGIQDTGGSGFVLIEECRFELLTGTAILGTATGAAVPLGWRVRNNTFRDCTHAIAMSATQGIFDWNIFRLAADNANNKLNLVAVAGQGSLNMTLHNAFSDVVANITIAKGYKPGTTDIWRNWGTGAADEIIVVPT